jgi:hypothetical protein
MKFRLILHMPRTPDIRLYDFYPLVHQLPFGHSVKETDLTPTPSDVHRPGILCFNYDIIQCSYHKRFWLAAQPASAEGVVIHAHG